MNLNRRLENIVDNFLEDNSFEELLEKFDLTPQEVFIKLYYLGMLDEDILEEEFEL